MSETFEPVRICPGARGVVSGDWGRNVVVTGDRSGRMLGGGCIVGGLLEADEGTVAVFPVNFAPINEMRGPDGVRDNGLAIALELLRASYFDTMSDMDDLRCDLGRD